MKKNFLTVAAMMVVAFFVSTEIAKAADVSFSGQIRTRWDATEQFGGGAGAPDGEAGGGGRPPPGGVVLRAQAGLAVRRNCA